MDFNLGAPVGIPVWGYNGQPVVNSQNQGTYISRTAWQHDYATFISERKLPVRQIVSIMSEQKAVFLACERDIVRI